MKFTKISELDGVSLWCAGPCGHDIQAVVYDFKSQYGLTIIDFEVYMPGDIRLEKVYKIKAVRHD